jgi:hypothetical protein
MNKLFIQTGQTPPRGNIVEVRIVRPSEKDTKNKTILVTGNPYRRVYQDSEGYYINFYGSKCRAFMAFGG